MRLRNAQKKAVIEWIGEGLQTDEINARAEQFDPPFAVSRQQVDFYRDRYQVRLAEIRASEAHDALSTGVALRAVRVGKLAQLASLLEADLFGGLLWVEREKSIGSGPIAKVVVEEEFNASEVQQYRGLLDDIAKELGERQARQLNTNVNIDWETVPDDLRDAFIEGRMSLDDVLRKLQR